MLNMERLRAFFTRELWQVEFAALSRWRRFVVQTLRLLVVLARELWKGDLTLRAMSLVYTTLLALVPFLAVAFSVLKAFGVHNQIEPLLRHFLAPLGPDGLELAGYIVDFVGNVRVGVLGAVGLLFLFYTVITLLQKIEESFDFVWRVQHPRPFSRRFADYLSVLLIGPVLIFAALAITASVVNSTVVQALLAVEPFGSLVLFAGRLLPYLIVVGAFSFLYIFIPNTRVRLRSALVGALVAGVSWQTTGFAFASVAATSSQNAIYSGFAILLLFMIWLYLSWVILLFGAQIAYYHQHPQQIRLASGRFALSARLKEMAGLVIMYLVTERFLHGGEPWTLDDLVARVKLPGEAIDDVLQALRRRGFLAPTGREEAPGYLPARDPDTIGIGELLAALRSVEEDDYLVESFHLDVPAVSALMAEAYGRIEPVVNERSIKDLVRGGAQSPPVPGAVPP